jgi:hypothetical protein
VNFGPVPEREDICDGAVPVGPKADVVFEMGNGAVDVVALPEVPIDECVGRDKALESGLVSVVRSAVVEPLPVGPAVLVEL